MAERSSLGIQGIVETSIYVRDLDETEAFYGTILELPVIFKTPGRHVFFRVGDSTVLLAFLAEATRAEAKTPHGAVGAGHFAMGVESHALAAWRQRLLDNDIEIEDEVVWPRGGKSIYFRDPSGNSAEFVTAGVWGLPSGW